MQISKNPIVNFLGKPASEFTKADIIKFVEENGIEMMNFRYVGADGRLKALNFVINNREYLDAVLTCGERVDGSSLFKHLDAGSSDLYVVPRYRTAYLNPFTKIPTIDLLCSYFDKDGNPLDSSPENIMNKAGEMMIEKTGFEFQCMGELEYYVISDIDPLFLATDQRGYHEGTPYNKFAEFRAECMHLIAQCGGEIKYGHSEVGNFTLDGKMYEQNEIEFLPTKMADAADQLIVAKWVMRTLAHEYGLNITFAPKITVGKAGSGMHVHTRLMKDGKNMMLKDGKLSEEARKAIAGYLDLAPSLSAFGNTNPTAYFRLVPHQEAPTNICWGDRNRSVLVRVPLGWVAGQDMAKKINPLENNKALDFSGKQTVEFRCPDGSADIYLLMAGLCVAARHGFEMENSLKYAEERYVDVNIFHDEHKHVTEKLKQLPTSCWESAEQLEAQRSIYEEYGVFSKKLIDGQIKLLKDYNDQNLRKELNNDPKKIMALVEKFFHCG